MNITDILEESPNGFDITKKAPKEVDEGIRYYLVQMNSYSAEEYPIEYGIVNYAMGKLLLADKSKPKISEERAKRIENALYHFNLSIDIFNQRDYPTMFAIISTMMGRLFRERAMLVSNRSFLADRSTPEDSVAFGIDQILEAFPIFFLSKQYTFEHAICSLEAGWLHVLQSEFLENFKDDSIREQAATYLERTISLSQKIIKQQNGVYSLPGHKEIQWDPLGEVSNFPEHIQLLMEGNRFPYLEGCALYLLGRLYQGWIAPGVKDIDNGRGLDNENTALVLTTNVTEYEQQNMEQAFEYLCKSFKPKYLQNSCEAWADAHHRAALLLIKYPKIVNPDYSYSSSDQNQSIELTNSDIHLEMALQHLKLTLRSDLLSDVDEMDAHFHLAQCAISKLQLIIDKVPPEKSVTKVIRDNGDGLELVQLIEEHLREALQRVTPASSQTTQDGFLYFFSCLKFSEYRMLEAACTPSLQPDEREMYLADSVSYLIDALVARPLIENTDLHYIASIQLSQLLLAVKRNFAASKSYSKSLFALSLIINRSLFCPHDMSKRLLEETSWQIGECLIAGTKDIVWNKLHFGPLSLNERTTAGYASWSFEEVLSKKVKHFEEDDEILLSKKDADSYPNHKASPPKGVPPLNLPAANNKRVYITGEQMTGFEAKKYDFTDDSENLRANLLLKKKPPAGAVPLFALGHNPSYDLSIQKHTDYVGPYGRRMRRRIPPLKEMIDIDRKNVNAFGLQNGRAAFLLPAHIKRSATKRKKRNNEAGTIDLTTSINSKLYGKMPTITENIVRDDVSDQEESLDEEVPNEENENEEDNDELIVQNDITTETRIRSRSIRPNTQTLVNKRVENVIVPNKTVEVKKSNMFSWLFGNKKKGMSKEKKIKAKKTKTITTWLFGDSKAKNKIKDAEKDVGMWASIGCFYIYMILSRQTRMQLIIRCARLHVLDGERTNYLLYRMNPKYLSKFYDLKQQLTKDCGKFVVPPMTLKELSQRSNLELQVLFKNQVKVNRKLGELEELLYNKISKDGDGFLPFVSLVPVFLRDLTDFDSSLLNAERLISNLNNEDALSNFKSSNAENNVKKEKQLKDENTKFSYDSVSSAALSKNSSGFISNNSAVDLKSILSTHQQMLIKQEREEKEEVSVGKMSLSLSQTLDGSNYLFEAQQGSKDMLDKYLSDDECMLLWNLPASSSQSLQVVLIFRDNSYSMFNNFSSQLQREKDQLENEKRGKKHQNDFDIDDFSEEEDLDKKYLKKGIIMEVAKSDIHTSHMLQYIQGYLDALNSNSEPMKVANCTDALRSLSCALSLTEFMHIIPSHVRSLVICCPPQMRLIPWHLLLIEQTSENNKPLQENLTSKTSKSPIEIHLCEKFCVRLGPNLALFELNARGKSALRQTVGMHRLCAIDGETGPKRLPGARGTDLEIACCAQTWSADPTDSHILAKLSAIPKAFQTGISKDGNQAQYLAFKKTVKVERRNEVDPMLVRSDEPKDFISRLKSKTTSNKTKGADPIKNDFTDNSQQPPDDGDESSSEQSEEQDVQADMNSITMCRVLHIAALKYVPDENELSTEQHSEEIAAIILPRHEDIIKQDHPIKAEQIITKLNESKQGDLGKFKFSSKDIIKQLYISNCALCVVSHYDLTSGLVEIQSINSVAKCDANCEFIEALHIAGAKTVIHPLWNGDSHGISTLAHLVFQIRFYSILPTLSKDKLSIVETIRNVQLWMRDVTADEVIAFIHKAPIPKNARKIIIDEMDSYVTASLTPEQKQIKDKAKSKAYSAKNVAADTRSISPNKGGSDDIFAVSHGEVLGNRIGGDQKFFNHFLYWGSFIVSGAGGGVHHEDLTIDKEEGHEKGHVSWNDQELDNMEFEASVLRLEGKIKDAQELEKLIRKLRREQLKKQIDAARATGARASRGIMDTLDYFDKKFLDQDSDEVSISDESSDENNKRSTVSKNLKPRESDSDEYDVSSDESFDDDDPLKKKSTASTLQEQMKDNPKFVPRALDLGSMKSQDVGFDKWKSKVSSLDMIVREPVLPAPRSRSTSVRKHASASIADSYEYNKIKAANDKPLQNETQEDYEARLVKLYEKKMRDKNKRRSKAATKIEDDEEVDMDESDEENLEREINRKKQLQHANEDSDDDEFSSLDSDNDENDYDNYRRKLKNNQNKKEKMKRTPSRFMLALNDIQSNIRSYSDVVKTISKAPEEKLMNAFKQQQSIIAKYNDDESSDTLDQQKTKNNCIIN